jgi:hypothetical protein
MTNIQAVLFEYDYWTTSSANAWLRKHKLKPIKKVHTTKKYYRYRIQNPDKFDRLRIKKLPSVHVSLVLGFN